MKSLFAAAALTLAFAASAQAQTVTATLATAVEKPRQTVIQGVLWDCKAQECKALTGSEAPTWQACKALTKMFGEVTAYTTLDAAKLERCNKK